MAHHNEVGQHGEQIAANYLISKGYKILERNWQDRYYEIDIIAEKDKKLIIVEVRSRSHEGWEHPKESINRKKIRNIVNATEAYILKMDLLLETQFDIISVIPTNASYKIEHIQEAFHPTMY